MSDNQSAFERKWLQRGLVMVVTAPLVYWALFTSGVSDAESGLTSILWFLVGTGISIFDGVRE